METINTTAQAMEYIVTWDEIKQRLKRFDPKLKYYGVPRGGMYLSAMLNSVDTPEEADIIIDDLLDSGATKERYKKYNKPFEVLFNKQIELKDNWLVFPWERNEQPVEDNIVRIFEYLKQDPNREGLKNTPARYIKFLDEFINKDKDFKFTTFKNEGIDEMIIQTNIPFYSLCEHHLAPFFGTATIAYIPNGKIVGLSKLARTLDYYARNFQNQERITTQIAQRLQDELSPKGVGVSLKAQHLCMAMRGIKKHDTHTITTKLLGVFIDNSSCRSEFISFLK